MQAGGGGAVLRHPSQYRRGHPHREGHAALLAASDELLGLRLLGVRGKGLGVRAGGRARVRLRVSASSSACCSAASCSRYHLTASVPPLGEGQPSRPAQMRGRVRVRVRARARARVRVRIRIAISTSPRGDGQLRRRGEGRRQRFSHGSQRAWRGGRQRGAAAGWAVAWAAGRLVIHRHPRPIGSHVPWWRDPAAAGTAGA